MRAGILTFSKTLNYGACLQALGLQGAIEEMDLDVEIIDYRCPAIVKRENPSLPSIGDIGKPKTAIRKLLSFPTLSRRRKKFDSFERDCYKVGFSGGCTEADIANRYEVVVVGSDQVWNPIITEDSIFFLPNVDGSRVRKIAYAASFGDYDVDLSNEEITAAIRRFNSIGVREKKGLSILEKMGVENAELVLDPTLLHEKEFWKTFATPCTDGDRYVFAYLVAERSSTLQAARELAKKKNCKLVVLDCAPGRPIPGAKIVSDCSPSEFLGFISEADYVLTSSFHGLCFSIIFEKNFWFFTDPKVNPAATRQYSLASSLGLEGRLSSDGRLSGSPINYSLVRNRLDPLRKQSLSYLARALK